jgi:hypothetical protein
VGQRRCQFRPIRALAAFDLHRGRDDRGAEDVESAAIIARNAMVQPFARVVRSEGLLRNRRRLNVRFPPASIAEQFTAVDVVRSYKELAKVERAFFGP